jgi:hypothetical protein
LNPGKRTNVDLPFSFIGRGDRIGGGINVADPFAPGPFGLDGGAPFGGRIGGNRFGGDVRMMNPIVIPPPAAK